MPQVGGCEQTCYYHMVSLRWNAASLSTRLYQSKTEHNLAARRIVKDHIHHVGGLRGVVITKELLNSTQCGRQRYHAYLEERQTEKEKKDKGAIGNLKRKKWYT